jgi:hypothetical protein
LDSWTIRSSLNKVHYRNRLVACCNVTFNASRREYGKRENPVQAFMTLAIFFNWERNAMKTNVITEELLEGYKL